MRGYSDVEDAEAIKRVSNVEAEDAHSIMVVLISHSVPKRTLSPSHVLYYPSCYPFSDRLPAHSR